VKYQNMHDTRSFPRVRPPRAGHHHTTVAGIPLRFPVVARNYFVPVHEQVSTFLCAVSLVIGPLGVLHLFVVKYFVYFLRQIPDDGEND